MDKFQVAPALSRNRFLELGMQSSIERRTAFNEEGHRELTTSSMFRGETACHRGFLEPSGVELDLLVLVSNS